LSETLSDLVRRVDEDRWLAAQFSDQPGRARLIALYAVVHEIAKTSETVREPQLGAIRLQWWRDGVQAALAGRPPQGHPALSALAQAHAEAPLSVAPFDQMIDARLADLEPAPFADWAALETYVVATAGATMTLAAQALRAPAAETVGIARAWGLCGLWRALAFQRARDRTLLPPGATAEDLKMRARAGAHAAADFRFPAALGPAVLYAALTPAYLKGAALNPMTKRWLILKAAALGRLGRSVQPE
jgi:phytoene/squalene synthetase